jgi:DNA-binding phage protein
MQTVKTAPTKDYQDYLAISLNDPQRAAGNIEMALQEKERLSGMLQLTLEDIVNARKKANNLSESAQLAYEKLAAILAQTDGQEIYNFVDLLEQLGLKINIMPSI